MAPVGQTLDNRVVAEATPMSGLHWTAACRAALRLTALGLACFLAGCAGAGVPLQEPSRPVPSVAEKYLIEDFERDTRWSIDSADNHGAVEFSDRHVSSGQSAMLATYSAGSRRRTIYRKEVDYDLSSAGFMWLDVYRPGFGEGVKCCLEFRTKDGQLFQTVLQPLKPGWNRDLEFSLVADGMADSVDGQKWLAAKGTVTRLIVLVFPGQTESGELFFDNLRCDNPAANRSRIPTITSFTPGQGQAKRYCNVETAVAVSFPALNVGPGDKEKTPEQLRAPLLEGVSVHGRFLSPDGEEIDVPGFFAGYDEAGEGELTYRVRFAPWIVGRWRYQISVRSGPEWAWSEVSELVCEPNPDHRGMVRVDEGSPRHFSYESGEPYYPIGQNVAWAEDYAPYLSTLSANGCNYVRIWTCPWNNPLETDAAEGYYDQESSRGLDAVFDLAEQLGVQVQFVLQYHGMLGADWAGSPYNRKNGGPCGDPRDFWINRQAKAAYRRYLTYVAARWGHSPSLFAWELFNEAHYAPRYKDEDVIQWHREMSRHLRTVDPYEHMITTSAGWPGALKELWRIEDIDFVQAHVYSGAVAGSLQTAYDALAHVPKPYFVGEIGRGWLPHTDQTDPEGRHLHNALWINYVMDTAGSVMPWWWDTYIEPNKLHEHFAALARFAEGEDRRQSGCRAIRGELAGKGDRMVQVQCLISHQSVLGYVYDEQWVRQPRAEPLDALLADDAAIVFDGLLAGHYELTIWDTYNGAVRSERAVEHSGGPLRVSFSAQQKDFAFKLKRQPSVTPGIRTENGPPAPLLRP
jgi:hypothetical protein